MTKMPESPLRKRPPRPGRSPRSTYRGPRSTRALPTRGASRRPPNCRPPPPAPLPLRAAPLGLYGFALTTALLQGGKTGLTEATTGQLAMGFGFFFGGLAQFVAGILEYQRRNTFGTVAFCW